MKNVSVFQSPVFDLNIGVDEKTGEQLKLPGRDCAAYISNALAKEGVRLAWEEPTEDETAWFLNPVIGDIEYEVMVSQAWRLNDDEPPRCWVIFIRRRKAGWLSRLLKRQQPRDDDVGPLLEIANRVLLQAARDDTIRDMMWMSEDDFWKHYAC